MRNSLSLIIHVSALFILITVGGCSSNAVNRDSAGQKPAVTITYDANFEGETPSGYLNLRLEMTIKNKGYESFNTSPSNFLVKVGEYSYQARDSSLETRDLQDGTEIRGKLAFQVPPKAATPRTGFTMTYSGRAPYNIQWVKASAAPGAAPESTTSDPAVNIVYIIDRYWLAAPGTPYLEVGPPGSLFLVAEMTIENKGYESFNIKPEYFSIEASSTARSVTAEVQKELIDWRILDIQSNGKYTGSLYFNLPTEVAKSFYAWKYKMNYSGVRPYNIRWTEVNLIRIEIDPAQSTLKPVYLSGGGSAKGRLAFTLPAELASANVSYKMKYHMKSLHNVQFFDSPNSAADVNRNPIAYPAVKVTYSAKITRPGESGRLYLIADVLIENLGYDTFHFLTLADNFYIEAKY